MRILALMTFDIFRLSLGDALKKMGHDVRYLGDFDTAELEKEIQAFKPDMVVDMGWDVWQQKKHYYGGLDEIGKVLRKHRLFHVYFAEEDWLHFDRWSKRYAQQMKPSYILTRSPLTIHRYEEMGLKARYFDIGCNPDFHKPVPSQEAYSSDVAVVANGSFNKGEIRYKSIRDLVIPLFEQDLQVSIWGRDWEGIGNCYPGQNVPSHMLKGILPFTETTAVYNSAKICISPQTCNDQLSNRTIDIMASGGFLLTSDTKAVREKLRPGINCVASSSPEETIYLIRYYLAHEEERLRIAKEGLKTARKEFAYHKTLRKVWPEIEREWKKQQRNDVQISSGNQITNGDFHQGPTAWSCHQAEANPCFGHGRAFSMRMSGGMDNAYIQQKISVQAGKVYLLQAYFANESEGSGAPVNVFIHYYTSDHQLIEFGLYHVLFATDMTTEWFHYRGITTKVPRQTAYALLLINKIPQADSVPLLVSDCKLTELPA